MGIFQTPTKILVSSFFRQKRSYPLLSVSTKYPCVPLFTVFFFIHFPRKCLCSFPFLCPYPFAINLAYFHREQKCDFFVTFCFDPLPTLNPRDHPISAAFCFEFLRDIKSPVLSFTESTALSRPKKGVWNFRFPLLLVQKEKNKKKFKTM